MRLAISEDGSEVVFTSADRLTPAAAVGEEDAYEFHWADGASLDGEVGLLANGHRFSGFATSPLRAIDASGRDAYLESPQQLVAQHTSTALALYDARIDGGFPAPVSPVECEGEACHGAIGVAPSLSAPSSTGTPTVGNLTPGTTAFPSPTGAKPKPKPLTRAQKLARALKACAKDKSKKKRATCRAQARRRYGPVKKAEQEEEGLADPPLTGPSRSMATQ